MNNTVCTFSYKDLSGSSQNYSHSSGLYNPSSRRKTDAVHISIRSGCFSDLRDATQFANCIKTWLNRYLTRHYHYAAVMLIGVSENNPRYGRMRLLQTGARGRPRIAFVPNLSCLDAQVGAHLHIMLLANPCETIMKELKEYINKKLERLGFGSKGNMRYTHVYDMKGLLEYILKQSSFVRTMEVNVDGVLHQGNDMGLTVALEELNADPDFVHKVVFSQLGSQQESRKSQPVKKSSHSTPYLRITFTITKPRPALEPCEQRASNRSCLSRNQSHCNDKYASTGMASPLLVMAINLAALYRLTVPP